MRITLRVLAGLTLAMAFSSQVIAADLGASLNAPSCQFASQSGLAQLSSATVKMTVHQYYDSASAALRSSSVIHSPSPAFVWASEAKFACGKAVGYFRSGTLDQESVRKCDCFYGRLTQFN
ncbi:MAG TPA: hypothetical protein VGO70_11610 [Arsenicitalea sp.]|jgi:hypothetical protein|nr:hypothetical protein [Arsenicitalea sp.]